MDLKRIIDGRKCSTQQTLMGNKIWAFIREWQLSGGGPIADTPDKCLLIVIMCRQPTAWQREKKRLWQLGIWKKSRFSQADGPAATKRRHEKETMGNVTPEERTKTLFINKMCLAVSLESCGIQRDGDSKPEKVKAKEREVEGKSERASDRGKEGRHKRGWEGDSLPLLFQLQGSKTSTAASEITEITWKQARGRVDYTNNPPPTFVSAMFVTATQWGESFQILLLIQSETSLRSSEGHAVTSPDSNLPFNNILIKHLN